MGSSSAWRSLVGVKVAETFKTAGVGRLLDALEDRLGRCLGGANGASDKAQMLDGKAEVRLVEMEDRHAVVEDKPSEPRERRRAMSVNV